MKKLIDYLTLSSISIKEENIKYALLRLDVEINEAIINGFVPYGDLKIVFYEDDVRGFVQPMVKYEDFLTNARFQPLDVQTTDFSSRVVIKQVTMHIKDHGYEVGNILRIYDDNSVSLYTLKDAENLEPYVLVSEVIDKDSFIILLNIYNDPFEGVSIIEPR